MSGGPDKLVQLHKMILGLVVFVFMDETKKAVVVATWPHVTGKPERRHRKRPSREFMSQLTRQTFPSPNLHIYTFSL